MKERRLVLIGVDLLLVNSAVAFAFVVWAIRGDRTLGVLLSTQSYWFVLLSLLWLAFEFLNGLYDLRVAADLAATTRALIRTLILVLIAYLAIFFFVPTELPRGIVVYHGVATVALMAIWRGGYIQLAQRTRFRRRALIVGAGFAGKTIAQTIRARVQAHYELVGFVDDDPPKQGRAIEGITVLGTHRDLVTLVQRHRVAEIVLAVTRDLSDDLFRALLDAQELGIELTPMPVLYEEITGRVPVQHIGDSWYVALPLEHAATGGIYPAAKRVLDLCVAIVGGLLFALTLPLIALAIRLDSPGPIFYIQERVGQGGRVFHVRKLRTMVMDAERRGQAQWASKNDPRVTRVGRLFRKMHLDEFPQFWNVLRGEMSVVGPRPERPEFVAQLEKQIPFYRLRHAVKPGMAGWALVNAGYVDSVDAARERVEFDLYYIKHQSIGLDLWILIRTAGQVLTFTGQ